MTTIAYVISSHGFGHAARACAVIAEVWQRDPTVRFELFTGTPAWFFKDSLGRPVSHHPMVTDVGLVQTDALREDLDASVRELRNWIPLPADKVARLAREFQTLGCQQVVCDVAPLGLAAAHRAGLPSILVENFTWDFIYRGYSHLASELLPLAEAVETVFDLAGHRVQTEPFCQPHAHATGVPPVFRAPRTSPALVRQKLGIPPQASMVLVTMGGIEWDYSEVEEKLANETADDCWLVIPGGSRDHRVQGHLVRLPHCSNFYHPDLVHAADAVLGKLGYSTIAEVWSAGIPFGYIPRRLFPESPPLEAWVQENLPHRRIEPESFQTGTWFNNIQALLRLKRHREPVQGGAGRVAELILKLL